MTGEFDIIEKFFAPLSGREGLALKDDVALLKPPSGQDQIVSKDLLVADVHFRAQDAANLIAQKALAVNVSDIVAKGGTPVLYWLGLALSPENASPAWLQSFSDGLKEAQQRFGCRLAGGDTTKSPQGTVISVTVLGYVPTGQIILRSGAAVGDDLYVTGTLGNAALGLRCLQQNIPGFDFLKAAYHIPAPPVKVGQDLAGLASAAADVSDGLIADCGHIAERSGVKIQIWQASLPKSQEAEALLASDPSLTDKVWSAGDDYQIAFTASSRIRSEISEIGAHNSTRIQRIGEVLKGKGVELLDHKGEIVQVSTGGYTHF